MPATNALWGEKLGSARAKMIIPVFFSTPWIQNFLENAKNWRVSNAKGLYWTSLFSHSGKSWNIVCVFQKIVFLCPAQFSPSFHPPQTRCRTTAQAPDPRVSSPAHSGTRWVVWPSGLWPLSKNKAQASSTAPSTFSPKLLSSCSSVSTLN